MVSNHISVGIAISCLNWNVRSQGAGYKTMKFAVGFHYFRSTNPKKIGPVSIVSMANTVFYSMDAERDLTKNKCLIINYKAYVFWPSTRQHDDG